MSEQKGTIIKVAGPLVVAKGLPHAKMYEVMRVSDKGLIGEVIEIKGDNVSIQVYEETSGVGPGEPVVSTGTTMSVELGPGLLESIYDGIQRPLPLIEAQSGAFIARGIEVPALDRKKKWNLEPTVSVGDKVIAGDVLGEVQETNLIRHKVMVPPTLKEGTVLEIKSGDHTVEEVIAVVEDTSGKKHDLTMMQRWSIRKPRPSANKKIPNEPLITGTRVLDTLFPITKGGAGCIPGPFGAGKTVTQQSLAKYCDAQIIVYIGCGERGNEMTDVLIEFPHLEDPNTGEPLMKRTILIANTSNMPVAAREASVYTGITIAEYYRDMGYNVALMADSTSRWAEALREMSGRLEEMPGEEGYPAYLGSRTAEFYERAGIVDCLGSDDRVGSLTAIGAVSPPGGDLSEPVTQNTLRVTKVFWGLDAKLAYRRHFPAINWLNSYSLYLDNIGSYAKKAVAEDYMDVRGTGMSLLQEESKLEEIVKLVGMDALSAKERLILESAKSIREDFLFQNAFDPEDAYTSLAKQYWMLKTIISVYQEALPLVSKEGFEIEKLLNLPVLQEVAKCKEIKADNLEAYAELIERIKKEIGKLAAKMETES
ncbi:V-type ATP synthase subunit A [Candidatus Peregrinibacteria bacterium CG22_combo_CG10-13_8_21_14_all_44_10]|nr:MAG: V-type ATP synthase subunit A [Candidatus Peregrinibacteria bacterium CG2_30_44_17]PIP66501.1 MAG: V-type ATP synthase subunit A [Candidatus Peregrinibacteria bacterium CG22_combo_CG10-13_8_21_14_all_44_10]PIS03866.1 MAG: V-type ATP synthase subunit A [Candidatus Peregrinibacteria bacterium CG10_big_fil_rev_8_21_14_0_10_44_7]PIX80289.1 MAG: V-type ATP synthase subunit A [Candidatus Peregrinibacteria bacterium CG_4_10_14_3_um_filter_44_21]PJB89210.1 MAG: V-type ATP synthase subunit A [Ca